MSTVAYAQCINNALPSCGVYEACFAKYCPCENNENEYFISYGLKYCNRFLENPNFSPAGKVWRDTTLTCLQESIVPKLDISHPKNCDCAAMKTAAYQSHVKCYTQEGSSICALPIGDIDEIRKIVDVSDTFSSEGWKQMKEVAQVCAEKAPNDGRRSVWRAISTILSTR